MTMQSICAKAGLRTLSLGSASSLALAAPLAEGSFETAAHTDASRIGFYFSRETGSEKIGCVVMGAETLAATPVGLDVRGVHYSWPAANAAGVMKNDGSGNLSWTALVTGVSSVNTKVGDVVLTYSDVGAQQALGFTPENAANKGAASGYAPLGADSKVPSIYLPAAVISNTYVVASEAAMLALSANVGDVAVRTDISETFILQSTPASTLGNWVELLSPGAVVSVNGYVGAVSLTYTDVNAIGGTLSSGQVPYGFGTNQVAGSASFSWNETTKALTLGAASSTTGTLTFANGSTADTVSVLSGATSASYSLTLPTAQGAAGTRLVNNGSGVMSWAVEKVTNIAALRALTVSYDSVEVLGYYASGDGGGGVFEWLAGDATTDNNGTYIAPSGVLVGRWKRVWNGELYAKWFGAKGDNVHDDTTAIQSCFDLSDLNGYGYHIRLDPGSYVITSPLRIKYRGTHFIGSGNQTTRLVVPAGFVGAYALYMGDGGNTYVFDSKVVDIDFWGWSAPNTVGGIYSSQCQEQTGVTRCNISFFSGYGIALDGTGIPDVFPARFVIDEVQIWGGVAHTHSVYLHNATANIRYCSFVGIYVSSGSYGVYCTGETRVKVQILHCERHDAAVYFEDYAGGYVYGVTLSNEGASGIGAVVINHSSNPRPVTMHDISTAFLPAVVDNYTPYTSGLRIEQYILGDYTTTPASVIHNGADFRSFAPNVPALTARLEKFGSGDCVQFQRMSDGVAGFAVAADGTAQFRLNGGWSSGAWNGAHATHGTYHQWVDATGSFRFKNGAPTSDLDGVLFESGYGNPASDGMLLSSTAAGVRSWVSPPTAAVLAATYIGFGSALGVLTGSSRLTWDSTAAALGVAGTVLVSPTPATGTPAVGFKFVSPAHTSLTATTEYHNVLFENTATQTFATGNITNQRSVYVRKPTYAFAGDSIIGTAATFAVQGSPVAGGHATITNPYSFWVCSGATRLDQGTITANQAALGITTGWNNAGVIFTGSTVYVVDGASHPYSNYFVVYRSNTELFSVKRNGITVRSDSLNSQSGADLRAVQIVPGAHTNITASTELTDAVFDFSHTMQWVAGDMALQRSFFVRSPTLSFVGASVVTTAATFALEGAPIAGANAAITNSYASLVASTHTREYQHDTGIEAIWNGAGQNFTSHRVNITDTASAIGSRFASYRLDGVERFGFVKSGGLIINRRADVNPVTTLPIISVSNGASTGIPAGAEVIDINFDLGTTLQHKTGDYAQQRSVYIAAPTFSFVGASVIDVADAVAITGSPNASTNGSITQSNALHIYARSLFQVATANALLLEAATAGTAHNYALNVGVGASIMTQGSTTKEPSVLSMTTTWNNVAVAFTGLKLVVTNGASAASSKFFSVTDNLGNYEFSFNKYGGLYLLNGLGTAGVNPSSLSTFNLSANAAHTNMTVGAELTDFYFLASRTLEWAEGALPVQRTMYVNAPILAFVGDSVVTTAATASFAGAPTAGAHCAITNAYTVWLESGLLALGSQSGSKIGQMVFNNGANANNITIQSGATSAAYTLTLPTDKPASTAFLKSDNAGGLSWDTGTYLTSVALTTGQIGFGVAGVLGGSTKLTWDDTNGSMAAGGATVTASKPVLDLSQTWSRGSTTFTGLKLNITNSGAAYASKLMDLQQGTNPRFTVYQAGEVAINRQAINFGGGAAGIKGFVYNAAASLATAAATEYTEVYFNLTPSVQFTAGSFQTQRAMIIGAPTYSATAGTTVITTAATLSIIGAPIQGAPAVINNSYAVWVQSGLLALGTKSTHTNPAIGQMVFNNASTDFGVTIQSGATSASYDVVLPPAASVAGTRGQVMASIGGGAMAWVDNHFYQGFDIESGNRNAASTIGFSPATGLFTLAAVGSTLRIWKDGKVYDIGTKTVTIPNTGGTPTTPGLYFITFDGSNLVASTTVWDLYTDVPVATVYYYSSTLYAINDERHNATRNRSWHYWSHTTIGTRYASGLVGTFTNTTLSLTVGVLEDEDIIFGTGGTKTTCRLWRYDGTRMVPTDGTTATPYLVNAGTLRYDKAGTPTNVTNDNYVINDVWGTTDPVAPIWIRVGTAQYNTLANANAALGTTSTWQNLPTAEFKLLYQVIYRNAGGTPTFISATDYRTAGNLPGGVGTLTYISGAGTIGTIPKWATAISMTDSILRDTGSALIIDPAGLGTLPALPTGTVLKGVSGSGNANVSRIMVDTFTGIGGGYSSFAGRAARGTNSAQTALGLGDEITHLSAWGYGATGYSAAARGFLSLFAAENWTDAAQGVRIGFYTTALGTVTTTEKVRIWGDGCMQIGGTFTASAGAGTTSMGGVGMAFATAAVSTVLDSGVCFFAFTGSTGSQTLTLPAANLYGAGRAQMMVITNRATVTVTVTRAGSDTVDGATSLIMAPQDSLFFFSNGSNAWYSN